MFGWAGIEPGDLISSGRGSGPKADASAKEAMSSSGAILVERDGPVTTVTINRQRARNALHRGDGQGDARCVHGVRGRCGCQGRRADGGGWLVLRRGRPEGAGQRRGARLLLGRRRQGRHAAHAVQAGDRRGVRPRGCRRPGAGGVVRPARRRRHGRVRRVLPALWRADAERLHGAPAAPDRPEPRARHDADRPRRRRQRSPRHRPRQPSGAGRTGAHRGRASGARAGVAAAGGDAVRPRLRDRAMGLARGRGHPARDRRQRRRVRRGLPGRSQPLCCR